MKIILILYAFLVVVSFAHAKTQFSSRYIDTSADCKCLENPIPDGQDCLQFQCKDMADYQIKITYDGSACDLGNLKIFKSSKELISVNEVPVKIEWRFADEKPFAMIYRQKGPSKNCSEQGVGKKAKKLLVVSGLDSYQKISVKVEANVTNANEKARSLADKGYLNLLNKIE